MTDTPPDVEALYHAMLMSRSGSDRVRMAAEMYDAAVAVIESSLDASLDPRERRKARFLRLYSGDFTPAEIKRILAAF